MITFLIIASLVTLITAWLLVMPLVGEASIAKRDKQKAVFGVTLLVIVFPLIFYLFFSR